MHYNSSNDTIIPRNVKLLASSNIYFELDAASEVWHILRATGICEDAEIVFIRKGKWWLRGLFGVIFRGDVIKSMPIIRAYIQKKPWILEYTHRIIPVELITNDINELKEFVIKKAEERISENSRWMIRVSKHDTKLKRRKVIEEVAKGINIGEVDLEKPDWVINIEIIRNTFAAAVIPPNFIIQRKEFKERLKKLSLSTKEI